MRGMRGRAAGDTFYSNRRRVGSYDFVLREGTCASTLESFIECGRDYAEGIRESTP